MNQYIVRKSIFLKATPDKVWDALTNPEKTKKYFFNCEVHSGWQVGDSITFKGKMLYLINVELKGEILAIEPGKLLKYSLKNGAEGDVDADTSIVTDVLTSSNGETVLTITDDVGDGDDAEKRYEKSEKGWDKVLAGLKELVEEDE